MYYMINTASVTELKQNTAGILKRIRSFGDPVVILQRSKPAAVLMDPDYYRLLEEALEDLEDLRAIEERKNEPSIPFDSYFKKRFKKKLAK